MFGDWSWVSDRTDEQYRRLNDWMTHLKQSQHYFVTIEISAGNTYTRFLIFFVIFQL